MNESSDLASVRELIRQAMTRDAARLTEALSRCAQGGTQPHALNSLKLEAQAAAARRERRRLAVPHPTLTADLPILKRRQEVADAIRNHQVVIVCGETGSGKTTQLPQICLAIGRGVDGTIGHTQPRRIAARSVAARIAQELDVPLGQAVGFQVRFHDASSEGTFIKLMTDGILLAQSQGDPDLLAYDTIIIDEAHERSLNIDFLLGYLKQLLPRRPDLKVIVTSATIDPQRFSEHFGGPGIAPVIEVSGRTYPVEVRYMPVTSDAEDIQEVEEHAVVDAVEELGRASLPPGDILVFLPGEREIRACTRALLARSRGELDVVPLYARLSAEEQDRVFRPSPRRRVVLATNVAETSITVPGIRYVVDSGLARQSKYDPRTRVQRLPIASISQASAQQRSGRCGRLAAGVCVRLYSERQFQSWPKFTVPEILRTNLASVILQMKTLSLGSVEAFPFVDPPQEALIRDGYQTLYELHAIDRPDASGETAPIGRRLARLPIDPRIARMVIAAEDEDCVREVLVLAAVLSIQDPRDRPMSRQRDADTAHLVFWNEHSDFMMLLNIWDQYQDASDKLTHGALLAWCRDRFVNFNRMREWVEMERQLRGLFLGEDEDSADAPDAVDESPSRSQGSPPARAVADRVHRALMTGLLSNLCCRDESGGPFEYQGSRGNRVSIFPGSVLFKKGPRWLMAAELVQTTRLYARTCAKVDPAWIEEMASHIMGRTVSDPHYDRESGEGVAWERLSLAGAVVVPRRRVSLSAVDPAAARRLFVLHALAGGGYVGPQSFVTHNRAVLEAAQMVEGKLRTRGLVRSQEELASWFDLRVPAGVNDRSTFASWLSREGDEADNVLKLELLDVLKPGALDQVDPDLFPDAIPLKDDRSARVEYRLDPGKETDGITATLPLLDLPYLTPERGEWLVPGMLEEKIAALFRGLSKQLRQQLDFDDRLQALELATQVRELLDFGVGSFHGALSEVVRVIRNVEVPEEDWKKTSLPDHLRLRLVVTDRHGKELAEGRNIQEIHNQLAGRLARAQAAEANSRYEKAGLTTWSFGPLPDKVETERAGNVVTAFPGLVDRRNSVSLSLFEDEFVACAHSRLGVRRLFAIAARDELVERVRSTACWEEMRRQFKAIGTEDSLLDAMICLVADRTFVSGQARILNESEFNERLQSQWGRLGQATIEVGGAVARILDARFKVAGRLSGGTPRQWAASVADIREHAAYLMPAGFLGLLSWERIRDYPRLVEALRERLFRLREDGRDAETAVLQRVGVHWKKFTGWVANAMAAERRASDSQNTARPTTPSKNPLPAAKRAAPKVNVDAGEWWIQPGALNGPIDEFRWALEEYRLGEFVPEAGGGRVSDARLNQLWSRVRPWAPPQVESRKGSGSDRA